MKRKAAARSWLRPKSEPEFCRTCSTDAGSSCLSDGAFSDMGVKKGRPPGKILSPVDLCSSGMYSRSGLAGNRLSLISLAEGCRGEPDESTRPKLCERVVAEDAVER